MSQNKEDEAEAKKKKKKIEAKPDFEMGRLDLLPGDRTLAAVYVKPGHWVMGTQSIKANNFDFQAELSTYAADRNGKPFEIAHTPTWLSTSRPAALPKGQAKPFESLYFAPPRQPDWKDRNVWFRRELATSRGGRMVMSDPQPVTYLPTYQYVFVVLAQEPDLYTFVKQLTSVSAPSADFNGINTDGRFSYYQVVAPKLEQRIPLASNTLTWTSLAYILWDGVNPKLFTSEQQQSLLDWIHWGGQVVISGPDSLDTLKGSFLEEYLPALKVESEELNDASFETLNKFWSVADQKSQQTRHLRIPAKQPVLGVKLACHAEANDTGNTGGLVLERRVGNGRIVVTAFPLAARELLSWGGSYDSFFHNCLLRRPRRRFEPKDEMEHVVFADYGPEAVRDPRFVSGLRFFSRDIGHLTAAASRQAVIDAASSGLAEEDVPVEQRIQRPTYSLAVNPQTQALSLSASTPSHSLHVDPDVENSHFGGYLTMPQSGVAGWNDRSGVADKAREALRDAAGISIPSATFVFQVLAVYLMVLVPINFGIFWLIGRVEWAWISAPILAIIGAVAVVRLAQLDIGFARSVTEVGTLEIYSGFPRGHLSRYTAMYTSLSTGYDWQFESDASLALPFPSDPRYQRSPHDSPTEVTLRRDRQMSFRGFQVPSNKTGMVHTEQMLDLGGSIRLMGGDSAGWEIRNETFLATKDTSVIRKTVDNRLEIAWIGDVAPKSSRLLDFAAATSERAVAWNDSQVMSSYNLEAKRLFDQFDTNRDNKLVLTELAAHDIDVEAFRRFDTNSDRDWNIEEMQIFTRRSHTGTLNLGQLADLATQRLQLQPGDVRLVGWTEQVLPGVVIRPSASQSLRRTLVLVHLARGRWPQPAPDVNCFQDVFVEKSETETEPGEPSKTN